MPSLKAKDRVSLCLFTFSDGRRCRTPRIGNHPHFCFYHAQKESQARAAETLGKDLAYFFSGDYLSACDLSTALARLIPAVLRGDVKPKTARTVAYLFQTLLQSIHVSQDEYINAFSTNEWRNAIRSSVTSNHNYRFPPAPARPQTQAPQPAAAPPANPPQPASQPTPAPVIPVAHPGIHPDRVGSSESSPSASPPQPSAQQIPAPPQPTSPIQSSPATQQPGQEASEPPRPVAVAPSASRQEPRPAAAPQTGPSGLPVLAPLPRGSRERLWVLAPINSFIINTYKLTRIC